MNPDLPQDTIAGISTPLGMGGIGVIRISGPQAFPIAEKLFRPKSGQGPFLSHRLHLGEILDPEQGSVLDEVFLVPMHGPKTYTREDVVEIQCHSGALILRKILQAVLKGGARPAEPGEFTKRAFLNGRIDLTQAEAVMDLIRSRTQESLDIANRQRSGDLGRRIREWKEILLKVLVPLEAGIDFPEEDLPEPSRRNVSEELEQARRGLEDLLSTFEEGRLYREGISAAIVGRPNVGKSSLLNCLLREDRAIVTALPGTTRDTIEETVNLNGIPVKFIDTAGLRPARDAIEEEGIRRTRECLERADLVVWVVDGSEPLQPEDFSIFPHVRSRTTLAVLNKQDLPAAISGEELQSSFPGISFIPVSALQGTGIDAVRNLIHSAILNGKGGNPPEVLICNARHQQALESALEALKDALAGWQKNLFPEFIVLDLQRALSALGEIVGETASEDVLERIFSQFCIGK